MKKQFLIDFHFSPYLKGTLSEVKPEDIVGKISAAGFNSLLLQAKCHWGFAYYPTKIGTPFPELDGDLVAEFQEATRNAGMDFQLYYSVRRDETAARQHPEWQSLDREGKPRIVNFEGYPAWWRYLCINTAYGDFCLQQLEELVRNYQFTGFFFDILHYFAGKDPNNGAPCYCRGCQRLWQAEFGLDVPRTLDRDTLPLFADFRDITVNRFMGRVSAMVHGHGKHILLSHNNSWPYKYDDEVVWETDSNVTNYYNPSLGLLRMQALSPGKPLVCFCGFDADGFGVTAAKEKLIWDVAGTYAHGAGINLWGAPEHRSASYPPEIFKKLAEVLAICEPIYRVGQGSKAYAEVGILYSVRDWDVDPRTEHLPLGLKEAGLHLNEEALGAYKMLRRKHIPVAFFCQETISEAALADIRLLAIPHCRTIRDEALQIVLGYLEKGGRLLITGESGYYTPSGQKHDKIMGRLIRIKEHVEGAFFRVQPDCEMDNPYYRIRTGYWPLERLSSGASEYFGEILLPALEQVSPDLFDSHDVRAGQPSGERAFISGVFGKGRYLYVNHLLFTTYLKAGLPGLEAVGDDLLRRLDYVPDITSNLPAHVEVVYRRKGNELLLVILNCSPQRPLFVGQARYLGLDRPNTVYDIRLFLRGKWSQALLNGALVRVKQSAEGIQITIPRLDRFAWVAVKSGQGQ